MCFLMLSGQYGIPRPWFFPFTKSYWFGEKDGQSKVPLNRKGNAEGEIAISHPTAMLERSIISHIPYLLYL